jgi:CBS-domain-containing membrane protein
VCHALLGRGSLSAGLSMRLVIGGMAAFGLMHPPAVSTALSFGLQAAGEQRLVLFGAAAVAITALLVGLQRALLHLARRLRLDRARSR